MSTSMVAAAVLLVFGACCTNVLLMEYLIQNDSGAGNLVTFLEYLFIAAEGFLFTARCGLRPLGIPFRAYYPVVGLHFAAGVCSNYALQLRIPMPLYMVFSSATLCVNMAMGVWLLGRRYGPLKYAAVAMITVGVGVFTAASAQQESRSLDKDEEEDLAESTSSADYAAMFWWTLGVLSMCVSLVLSARVGIYQEVIYGRYGKHARDALYISHILPLPGFAMLHRNIIEHAAISSASQPITLPFIHIAIPIQWLLLAGNVLTQFVCIRSVYALMAECSSLTVTLVLTLRRFASLLFSIVYFGHAFGAGHWTGTICVCMGTVLFAELMPAVGTKTRQTVVMQKADKEQDKKQL